MNNPLFNGSPGNDNMFFAEVALLVTTYLCAVTYACLQLYELGFTYTSVLLFTSVVTFIPSMFKMAFDK